LYKKGRGGRKGETGGRKKSGKNPEGLHSSSLVSWGRLAALLTWGERGKGKLKDGSYRQKDKDQRIEGGILDFIEETTPNSRNGRGPVKFCGIGQKRLRPLKSQGMGPGKLTWGGGKNHYSHASSGHQERRHIAHVRKKKNLRAIVKTKWKEKGKCERAILTERKRMTK